MASKHFLYLRVSSHDQSSESQLDEMTKHYQSVTFSRVFDDSNVRGDVPAAMRPAMGDLLKHVRGGDVVYVRSLDRMGRDTLDVVSTIRTLHAEGVRIETMKDGCIDNGPTGEMIATILAAVAQMERARIKERTAAGRETARAHFERTGRTHKGKDGLGGAKKKLDAGEVRAWREANAASLNETAAHFGISKATVARYLQQ